MKRSLTLAMLSRSTNRFLILLLCLLTLPCRAAEPAPNLTGQFVGKDGCGDAARFNALKQRIMGTIQQEVIRRTAPDMITVEEQDLQIQTCPPQGAVDSEFVIKAAEYDAARDITVFWLASSQRGNVLPPLIVTVHKQRCVKIMVAKRDLRSGQVVSMNDFVETTQSSGNVLVPAVRLWGTIPSPAATDPAPQKPAIKTRSNSVMLVKVGTPAELVVTGKNFKGSMTVIPLESGGRGEELRVRDPGTRNILRARVTSTNQLEGIF